MRKIIFGIAAATMLVSVPALAQDRGEGRWEHQDRDRGHEWRGHQDRDRGEMRGHRGWEQHRGYGEGYGYRERGYGSYGYGMRPRVRHHTTVIYDTRVIRERVIHRQNVIHRTAHRTVHHSMRCR